MNHFRKLLSALFVLFACHTSHAQIEVDHLFTKGFSATGFGGFLNFAVQTSDADFVTTEIGLGYFSSNDNNIALAPLLVGYRYTLDRTGLGFYVEPNAGYSFGATDIQLVDNLGDFRDANVAGPAAGAAFGYLFPLTSGIQFNLSLRYEHIFGSDLAPNTISLRIAHAITFGRRESSY